MQHGNTTLERDQKFSGFVKWFVILVPLDGYRGLSVDLAYQFDRVALMDGEVLGMGQDRGRSKVVIV